MKWFRSTFNSYTGIAASRQHAMPPALRKCLELERLEDRCLLSGITEFQVPTPQSSPETIITGPDNNLWFSEFTGSNAGVARLDPVTGTFTEFPVGTSVGGLTRGPDGNLWFCELGANKIGRMTPAGVVTGLFTLPNPNSGPAPITAGPRNTDPNSLWFGEAFSNKIGRMDPTTGFVTNEYTIPTPNSGPNNGITAGPLNNDLWFTEYVGKNIGRITTTGIITEFRIPTVPHWVGLPWARTGTSGLLK
jgi:virginiamycin B lyase